MKHHVKRIRRVLRRDRRAKITQIDSNGNQQSLEWCETELLNESEVEHGLSSDPWELLEVEPADHVSCAPSESPPVEQTDEPPKKGFWQSLWEKIESNFIWDLIKIMLGAVATLVCLVFPQLKTATFEKAAVSTLDYMASVCQDIHVVFMSLF